MADLRLRVAGVLFLVFFAFTSSDAASAGEGRGRATRPSQNAEPGELVQPVVITPANFTVTSNRRPPVTGTAGPSLPVQVWLDGSIRATVSSDALGNWAWTIPTDLLEGEHEVGALVDYGGGLIAGSNLNRFFVDLTPPDTTVTSGPAAVTNSTSASFAFEGLDMTTPFPTFECRIDGGPFIACGASYTVNGLAEGAHTLSVRAIDMVGNVDGSPATWSWSVDITPPDTTLTSVPPPVSGGTASFSFTGTDPQSNGVTSGVASYVCASGPFTLPPCSSPFSWMFLDGSQTFTVAAVDGAGNVDPTPASYTWTVDTRPPDLPVISTPPSGAFVTTNLPVISGTAEPFVTVTVSIDGSTVGSMTADAAGSWSYPTTVPLTEGMHSASARATDSVGNPSWGSASVTFYIDSIPPDTVLNSAPPALTTSSSAEFTFERAAFEFEVPQFQCSLDGAAFATCASPYALNSLPDGSHTFIVRAVDLAGNVDPTPPTHTWTIDTTPPDTTITAGPAVISNSANATFVFTAFDAGSGVAAYQCTVDGGPTSCTSPLALAGLTEGTHTFSVAAVDNAGHVEVEPASYSWTIDTTSPPAPSLLTPANGSTIAITLPVFTGTAEPGTTVSVGVDGSTIGTTTADASGNYSLTAPLAFADGMYSARARAIDPAGNPSPDSTTNVFRVDTLAPATTVTAMPPVIGNSSVATFQFTGDDGAGSGVARFECSVDGAVASCTSPLVLNGVGEGPHTFAVRAVDVAGNRDATPASHAWIVDVTAPETTITSSPAVLSSVPNPSFTFSGSDANGPLTFEHSLDGGAFVAGSSPLTFVSITEGSHTLQVRAIDAAGNLDPTPASYTWTVDITPPAMPTVVSPADGAIYTPLPANVAGGADPGTTVHVSLDGGAAVAVIAGPTGAWSTPLAPLAEGTHTLAVFASDAAGNVSGTRTVSFTFDRSTVTTLSATSSSSAAGTVILFSAIVNPGAPGKIPTGTVTFTIDGVAQPPVAVAGFGASLPAVLPLGTHTITATYDGNAELSPSTSAPLAHVVVLGPATPDRSRIDAAPLAVAADGVASSLVTVTILDPLDNPISGHSVTVAVASGSATVTPLSPTTNASGIATFAATSTTPGVAVFTATDTTAAVQLARTASVTFTPIAIVGSISPESVCTNLEDVSITVTGSGFTPATNVRISGSIVPTTFVSESKLMAVVAAALLPQSGTVWVDAEVNGVVVPSGTTLTVTGDTEGPSIALPATMEAHETEIRDGIRGTTPAASPELAALYEATVEDVGCAGVVSYVAEFNGEAVGGDTFFAVGDNVVTVTASDAAGNTTVSTVVVTVRKLDATDLAESAAATVPVMLQYIAGNLQSLDVPQRSPRRRGVEPPMPAGIDVPLVLDTPIGRTAEAFVMRITFDRSKVVFLGVRDAAGSPFAGATAATIPSIANESGVAVVAGIHRGPHATGRINLGDVIVRELVPGGASSVSVELESVVLK